MRHHRVIWIVTGCIVVLAAGIVVTRKATAPGSERPRLAIPVVSDTQVQELIRAMLNCLERDPRAQRVMTRRLVEAVADLAERASYESAETYYALGLRLYGQRQSLATLERAEWAYQKAIEYRRDWAMAHNGLGIVLHSLGRLDAAEAAFREASALAPEWSRPHNDLAILYRLSGRIGDAEVEALRALELDPNNVATHNNYGNLLLETERFDEAQDSYRRALELDPEEPAPYYNLACLASKRGQADEAFGFLTCAIALDQVYREEAKTERHFAPLRDSQEFRRIVYGDGDA